MEMHPPAPPAVARRPGFTVNESVLAVVCLGIVVTAAIPRFLEARYRTHDAVAVEDLNRATERIAHYARQHEGALPATPQAAGFVPSSGIRVTVWKIQTVGGVGSVHVHARHRGSPHQFHAHHPLESSITTLPWEW